MVESLFLTKMYLINIGFLAGKNHRVHNSNVDIDRLQ